MSRQTELQRRQDAYRRAVADADRARAQFRAAIRKELSAGRTLESKSLIMCGCSLDALEQIIDFKIVSADELAGVQRQ